MIKHDTFNDKFSSRLTQNGSIIIMISNWSLATYLCLFSISIQISFGYVLKIVKQQTVNTCKVGYN